MGGAAVRPLSPRSATSLSPDTRSKARKELLPDFSLLHTLPCALISPVSPSMPSSFRASLERGCAPRETPDPPREKPPCPPLPGRAASL